MTTVTVWPVIGVDWPHRDIDAPRKRSRLFDLPCDGEISVASWETKRPNAVRQRRGNSGVAFAYAKGMTLLIRPLHALVRRPPPIRSEAAYFGS